MVRSQSTLVSKRNKPGLDGFVESRQKCPQSSSMDLELDDERKKELIKCFTESASKLTGIDKSAFTVYLRASSPDKVGIGGELLKENLQREKLKSC